MWAAYNGNDIIVEYLVDHGANIEKANQVRSCLYLLACAVINETLSGLCDFIRNSHGIASFCQWPCRMATRF